MSTTKAGLLKVIRMKCLDCTCDQIKEVQLCPSEDCLNWPFRMGKDPYKTPLSDAKKAALAAAREKAAEGRNEKTR